MPSQTMQRNRCRNSALRNVIVSALACRCGWFLLSTSLASEPSVFIDGIARERQPPHERPPTLAGHGCAGAALAFLAFSGPLNSVFLPAVGGPAFAMLLGGMFPGHFSVSKWGLCASQYFSAGMILAVCGSLTKDMTESGLGAAVAIAVGFTCGIATMVIAKKLTEKYGECPHADHDHDHALSGQKTHEAVKGFPWPLTFAVGIDCLVDGLLLGMIAVENPRAVLMMSTATALEMAALGFSFSTALKDQSGRARIGCIVGMPLLLMLGGCIGALLAIPLRDSPLALTGLMSFGISALVYLVTQELLTEANERKEEVDKSGTTVWFLFGGYLLVLLIGTMEG